MSLKPACLPFFEYFDLSKIPLLLLTGSFKETQLVTRAEMTGQGITLFNTPEEIDFLPLIKSRPDFVSSLHRRALLTIGSDDHGVFRSVFLFMPHQQPVGFLAAFHKAKLTLEEEAEFAQILQHYYNFLDFLDYGDFDELTGLLNRKTFNSYFRNVIENISQKPSNSRFARASITKSTNRNENAWLAVADH